jgi:protein SCO1
MTKRAASSSKKPKEPSASSVRLIKWYMLAGILTLVLVPLLTYELAVWKFHQDEQVKAAVDVSPEALSFGGHFKLVNQDGVKVTDATYRGKYLLVLFGYTYCPDICPTVLQDITEILDQLGEDAGRFQTLFITIDPKRDKPAKLKEYIASFHSGISGLTGTEKQIAAVAKAYNVHFAKGEDVEGGDYEMELSSFVYLLDPEGKPVARIDVGEAEPEVVAGELRRMLVGKK